MKVVRMIVVLLMVLALVASCQGGMVEMDRSVSAAQTSQDVVDAWNMHCATFNFLEANGTDSTVVGFMYYGTSFDTDADGLSSAMQGELLSGRRAECEQDDLLSAVINDPAWYQ